MQAADRREPTARALWRHGLLWVGFAAAMVAVRGPRWDETYEWAQVLLGHVQYPESHPHYRYVHSVFTIQPYVSAAILWLNDAPMFLSFVRNTAMAALAAVPIFLFAARLGGGIWVGHVAVLLALCGALQPFETTYPLRMWPHPFSNGPIGTGWALLTVYCLAFRHWKAAVFLWFSMPAVHLGQYPPVFATGLAVVGLAWRRGKLPPIRAVAPYAAGGLAVTLIAAALVWSQRVGGPISEPYASSADAFEIWSRYKEVWYHTTLRGGVHSFLLSTVAIGALLLLCGLACRESAAAATLLLFGSVTALGVYLPMAIHSALGVDTPWFVLGWIPYRLANFIPPLLLALTLGLSVRHAPTRAAGHVLTLTVLLGAVLVRVLNAVVDRDLWQRYVADQSWALLLLSGFAATMAWRAGGANVRGRAAWLGIAAFTWLTLAWFHQFAAATILAGVLLGRASILWRDIPAGVARWSVYASLLAAGAIVIVEWHERGDSPADGFDVPIGSSALETGLMAYLAEHSESDSMILTDNYAAFLQARLGRPVMAHWMTDSFSIYTPGFGPSIQRTLGELYGIEYGVSEEGRVAHQPDVWQTTFARRSPEEWEVLAEKYAIDYILTPSTLRLTIPAAWEGDMHTLYLPRPLSSPLDP